MRTSEIGLLKAIAHPPPISAACSLPRRCGYRWGGARADRLCAGALRRLDAAPRLSAAPRLAADWASVAGVATALITGSSPACCRPRVQQSSTPCLR